MSAAAAVRELTITRIYDAPRELVFRAFTDPAHIAKWWGPKDFTMSCARGTRSPEAASIST
jgi:uncharacterized protein YndB with AHSA1/START domain